jgi:transposase
MEKTMQSPPSPSPYAPDLSKVRAWLEQMIKALKFLELVSAVVVLIGRMSSINAELTKQLTHLRSKRPRSETMDRLQRQLQFRFEIKAPAVTVDDKEEPKDKTKPKKHGGGGRGTLPARLPRVQIVNDVPADRRMCPLCGAEMKTIGHSVCASINVIPARIVIEERLDETVACPHDDTIVSAEPPPQIVERGKLGDTLIVEALADKYIEHQPIERQATRFARAGVDIAPQTLGRSVTAAIDLLMPVAKLIEKQTRGPGLLGTDATGIPILDPSATMGIRTGAIWCWTNARWVSFVYSRSATSESVRTFLGTTLARDVQCDGANVFDFIERAGGSRPGCWAHGRRRCVDAARLGDTVALEGLRIMARLFAVERESTLAGDTAESRRERRREQCRPVLDELEAWMTMHRAVTPPKTPLGQALRYLHRQWRRLLLFLDNGNIELTNNRRERELRRLVLGRRNWLFTWLDEGGERTAAILTILATCIAHDINPRAYLHIVTRHIVRGWPNSRLRDLLPDRIVAEHPELYVGEASALPSIPDASCLSA